MNTFLTISGHARLSSDTGGYYDNVCATESLLETRVLGKIATDPGPGVDMVQIGSNAGYVNNIVE